MLDRIWVVYLVAALWQLAPADDIVFSSAPVAKRGGAYYRSGPAHLYRCRGNGADPRQVTDGAMDDTDPCVAPDGGQILFWRRDRHDLIGKTWLCSILPDGTRLRVIRRMKGEDLGSPLMAFTGAQPPDPEKLPGIPSNQGGTSMPESISVLQDGTYVFGYYEAGPKLGMADRNRKPLRQLTTYKVVHGKKQLVSLVASTQWKDNPDGAKTFWFGPGRKRILLQKVVRDERGGTPYLYFVDAHSGEVSRQIGKGFIGDVDSARRAFLTTTWKWGSGFLTDHAEPLRSLSVWVSPKSAKPVGPRSNSCYGACFLRTRYALPTRPNTTVGIKAPKARAASQEIVFSAQVFGENLGNVCESAPSHLYRIRTDGTGLRQLTTGDAHDVQPTLTEDRKRIFFWRARDLYGGAFRLYVVSINGGKPRSLHKAIKGYPSPDLAPAMLQASPGMIGRGDEPYGNWFSLFDRQRHLISAEATFFSPNGRKAVARTRPQSRMLDLLSGKVSLLSPQWLAPAWIDDRTLVAFRLDHPEDDGAGPGEIVYLNVRGRAVFRKNFDFSHAGDEGILPTMFSSEGRAALLWNPYVFLWVAHHQMSDGGYDFLHLIEMKRGEMSYLGEGSLESVSPDGRAFVATHYDWVGGYKGAGADKLGIMSLWDAKALKSRTLGFRRMICYGACFIPAG